MIEIGSKQALEIVERSRRLMGSKRSSKARFGESNGNHRLTIEQVEEIRERYRKGGVSMPKLAREYGVSTSTIGYIIQEKTWTHCRIQP